MILKKIFVAITIIGFVSCSKKDNKITVKGKIYGKNPDKIEYTVPVRGTWFFGAKKSATTDSLGNFEFSFKTDASSFITLYVPKQASGILLVEPNENYNIEFHLDSKEEKIKVTGKNSKALNLYNSFAHPDFYVLNTSNELLKDSVLTTVLSKIDKLKDKEIQRFKEQSKKQIITKDFYDLAELDRNYYYSALKTSIATIKFKAQLDSTETQNAQIIKLWKDTFNQTPPSESFDTRSPWSYVLMKNYIDFYQYDLDPLHSNEKQKIIKQGKHAYEINKAKKYLKGKALEYYYATYILSNTFWNKDNSKELITLFKNFKNEYPNSNYSDYLALS